jgi:hypothetical protein
LNKQIKRKEKQKQKKISIFTCGRANTPINGPYKSGEFNRGICQPGMKELIILE